MRLKISNLLKNLSQKVHKIINKEKLLELEKDYTIMSLVKMENNLYSEEELNNYIDLMKEHFYVDGIINCPYIEDNNIVDTLILIPKTEPINV
mgnify:CR=1 FL=1